jgi:hypothetical protein
MAYSIQNIKSNLTGGGARSCLFKVSFNYPSAIGAISQQKLEFLCKGSIIPESTINAVSVAYMGREVKLAGTRPAFADWTVSILNDEDFAIRNDLEKWMNYMNGHVDNQQVASLDYKTDGIVTQLSKDGSKLREYKFKGIFPTSVASIALDWATEDIQSFDVTFAVDWWEASGITYPKGDNGSA